jgi:hypothetical protein
MTKNRAIRRAIAAIPGHRLDPGALPRRGTIPTGAWISYAEVAEVPYTTLRHEVAVLRRTTAEDLVARPAL